MKPIISSIIFGLLVVTLTRSSEALVILQSNNIFVVNNGSEPGTLELAGSLSAIGSIDFGTAVGDPALPAVLMDWSGSGRTAIFGISDLSGSFEWRDNLAAGAPPRTKMRLDGNNSLSIFGFSGSVPSITLNGLTGGISAGSLTVAGSPVVTVSTVSSSILSQTGIQLNSGMMTGGGWENGIAMGPISSSTGGAIAVGYNATAASAGNLALGWSVKAVGSRSAAIGHGAEAHGYESFAMGRSTRAYGNLNFAGGWHSISSNYNSFVYGHYCAANSGYGIEGYDADTFAISMGSYSGALSDHTIALGYGAVANAPLGVSIGRSLVSNTVYELTTGCFANVSPYNPNWNESDVLYRLGNGTNDNNRSDAITTLKNGRTTLTNKAWKANPAVAPTPANSNAEALVVEGNTRLRGKVVLEVAQGDISMGIYQ